MTSITQLIKSLDTASSSLKSLKKVSRSILMICAKIGNSARVLLEMIRSRLTESELQSEYHEKKY